MDKKELLNILEALIFTATEPVSMRQLLTLFEVEQEEIVQALEVLDTSLQDRAIFLKKVAGGYQFATRPEYAKWIKQMNADMERSRLSRAALEALSIITFKQPISRVEINAIRGVNSDGVIKGLLERKLIDIAGRDDGQGRAILLKTTKQFLHHFGINDLNDLPKPKEIEDLLANGEGKNLLNKVADRDETLESDATPDQNDKTEEQPEAAAENETKGANS